MSDARTDAKEPSMEEILASIRRIIAEEPETPVAAAPKAETPKAEMPKAAPEKPVLVEKSREPGPDFSALSPEPALAEPILKEETMDSMDVDFFDAADESPLELTQSVAATPVEDRLLSQTAAGAAAGAFSHLSGLLVRNYPNAGATIEDLLKDMLRPMLKEWLDANLPAMTERMVAQEIARISGRQL